MNKKITLSTLAILIISIAIVSLYKTFAYNVTSTISGTTLNFNLVTNTQNVTVSANSSKELVYKIQNENQGAVKYEVFHNINNPNISIAKAQGGDPQSGTINKNEYKYINIRINNTTPSEVTVSISTVLGFEKGGELIVPSGWYPIEEVYKDNIIDFISSLGESEQGDGGIYAVRHRTISANDSASGKEIPATVDYRYYGKNPNNYLCFEESCEDGKFRIIGLVHDDFTVQNKVKIISENSIKDENGINRFAWNKTSSMSDSSYYQNIWSANNYFLNVQDVRSGSTLMSILNNEWISGGTVSSYFGETDYQELTFNRKETIIGIANLSRRYLGALSDLILPADIIYNLERGTANPDPIATRAIYWDGGASLMSLSDYGYASKECTLNMTNLSDYASCTSSNWLFNGTNEYTINVPADSTTEVYYITSTGAVDKSLTYIPRNARVVLYLTTEAKVISGDGSESNPYIYGKVE